MEDAVRMTKTKRRTSRPQLKIASVYMMMDGKRVPIDPFDPAHSDLQARCKLAWAEMTTGQLYELVERKE